MTSQYNFTSCTCEKLKRIQFMLDFYYGI